MRGYWDTLPARRCLQRAARYIINYFTKLGIRPGKACDVEGSTPSRVNGSSVGRVHNMLVRPVRPAVRIRSEGMLLSRFWHSPYLGKGRSCKIGAPGLWEMSFQDVRPKGWIRSGNAVRPAARSPGIPQMEKVDNSLRRSAVLYPGNLLNRISATSRSDRDRRFQKMG